jgi:hypothetical protein
MNGLRVYVNTQKREMHDGYRVFYSRRENGPYYRWRYDQKLSQWRVSRQHSGELTPNLLCKTNWKAVPEVLQVSMVEHYQE